MIRFPGSVSDFTRIHIQGATQVCSVVKQPIAGGQLPLQYSVFKDIGSTKEIKHK